MHQQMMTKIGQDIKKNLPQVVSKGLDMIQGLSENRIGKRSKTR